MMRNVELETVLNNQLNIGAFQDYAPNGCKLRGGGISSGLLLV